MVAQNDHDHEVKKSRTPEGKKDQGTKKEEGFQQKFGRKSTGEENTISNRRHYCISIPPLTSIIADSKKGK